MGSHVDDSHQSRRYAPHGHGHRSFEVLERPRLHPLLASHLEYGLAEFGDSFETFAPDRR